MSAFTVYCILLLNSIGVFLSIVAAILFIAILVISISYYTEDDYFRKEDRCKEKKKFNKKMKFLSVSFLSILIILTFCPGTSEVALMYIIPKITKNKEFKQIPPLLMKYIEKSLDTSLLTK